MDKLRKISWKVELDLDHLYPYGKIYELKTLQGTCPKIGLILDKETTIFVKGNKNVIAHKGELIEFVCSDIKKGKYRQFNIIGNIKDKCIFIARFYKNGKRKKIDCDLEKENKPQEYISEKKQGQALAELVYLYGSDAQLGNADRIITKIIRRKDNRIVVQMNEYKNTRGGAKAVKNTEQYFLFQEKDRKLIKSEMPKDYTLVDAKTEVLKKGEKAKANTLDKIYSNKEEIKLCAEIEKEMLRCKEGACDPSEKAYYQKLIQDCSEKAGKQQFFKDMEEKFLAVFNAQKRGESFWQAYNRIQTKVA